MDKKDKEIESIVEEYKMSMGGRFFNKSSEDEHEIELETFSMDNAVENHLFDTYQLLSVYDELSDFNKREFFRKVIVAFIEFKFDENREK